MCHNRAILIESALALNGNLAELTRLAAEIDHFSQKHSLPDEVAFDLNLALEELFTNALRHGGCEGMEDAVHIRVERQRDGVLVEFCDRGSAFDPLSAPPPNLEGALADRPVGGLGIHLVRQMMSDLRYERSGQWNRITMRKPI